MFERYMENARRIIFFARYEASISNALSIAPEHILLGIIREDAKTLRDLLGEAFSPEALRCEMKQNALSTGRYPPLKALPLSISSKMVLAWAGKEADRFGSPGISTQHLLAGLLIQDSLAAKALASAGFTVGLLETMPQVSELDFALQVAKTKAVARSTRWIRRIFFSSAILFAFLFFQLSIKTLLSSQGPHDALFYTLSLSVPATFLIATGLIQRRRGVVTTRRTTACFVLLGVTLVSATAMILHIR